MTGPTDETFQRLMRPILKWEGGYVNHKHDKGGETKFGITKRRYPELDIKALRVHDAVELYWADFAVPLRLAELPRGVRLMVLDGAINHGVRQSAKYLQRAAGVHDDGVIGPKTLAAAAGCESAQIIHDIAQSRLDLYFYLVRRDKTQRSFLHGWMRRLVHITADSVEELHECVCGR